MSFRVEVLAIGETKWATNELEFATEDEAREWGRGLYYRWTMAKCIRVVSIGHPRGETYVAGSEEWP